MSDFDSSGSFLSAVNCGTSVRARWHGEEAHVGVLPLIEPRDQLLIEVFFAHVVVEGLVRVEGAADELVGLDDGPVIQFNTLCLAVLDDDPLDHAAADHPAAVLGDVLAQQVGHMVGAAAGEAEVPAPVDHQGHEVAQTLEVVVEAPHGGEIEEEGPDLVILEPRVHDLLGGVARQFVVPLGRGMELQLCRLFKAGQGVYVAGRRQEDIHRLV